mmetsp:Transcript_36679/g.117812  ORF Transcript_36679/g.117812 Transcript_36679/m.117812 type:complete len:308 (+) Transcript_36679:787-1710(+)
MGAPRGEGDQAQRTPGKAARRMLLRTGGSRAHRNLLLQRGAHGAANVAVPGLLFSGPPVRRRLAGARGLGGRVQLGGRSGGRLGLGRGGGGAGSVRDALRHWSRCVRHRAASALPVGLRPWPVHQRVDGQEVLHARLRRHAHHSPGAGPRPLLPQDLPRPAPSLRHGHRRRRRNHPPVAYSADRPAAHRLPLPVRGAVGAAQAPLPAFHAVSAGRRARRRLAKGGGTAAGAPVHARLPDGNGHQAPRHLARPGGVLLVGVVATAGRRKRILAGAAGGALPRALHDQPGHGGRVDVAGEAWRGTVHRG